MNANQIFQQFMQFIHAYIYIYLLMQFQRKHFSQ